MSEVKIMLGNEAIARGAYEAGVKVSAAYPGTPSTEISESLAQYAQVYCEWSPNEKVAMEVAIGASMSGVRAMACMKHVGVNVASDPLFSASYIGVNGGLVLVAADDPGLYSSQNEQDTRWIARAAQLPVLEPSDCEEAKQFIKKAFLYSETYDTPIILRTTTRLSHSREKVLLECRDEVKDKPYVRNPQKNVMLPAYARKRHIFVEERMKRLEKDSADFTINKIEYNSLRTGIITSGMAYQYVKEAVPDASVLKLGMVNPLPRKLIEEFASRVSDLYIVEELEPVIEEQVKAWGIACKGKELFTRHGEYSAALIRQGILQQLEEKKQPEPVLQRPPVFCPGCPHRSVFLALNRLHIHAAGDIGCYTLGALEPFHVIDSVVCMGAGISALHGMEKAKGKEYIKDWVAVIGDSTFMHTGINSLINMVYNQGTGTVIILDNGTTGMTGHQAHAATGETLQKDIVPAISISGLCKAIGVTQVYEVDAFDQRELERLLKETKETEAVTVIVAKAPCVLGQKNNYTDRCEIDSNQCKTCGACLKSGCPALYREKNQKVFINQELCNGCGLCQFLCPSGAVRTVSKRLGMD